MGNSAVLAESALRGSESRKMSEVEIALSGRSLNSPPGCWMCEKDDAGCQTFDCYDRGAGGACISKDWMPYASYTFDTATKKHTWFCNFDPETQYGGYDVAYVLDDNKKVLGVTCVPRNLPDGHCPSPQSFA